MVCGQVRSPVRAGGGQFENGPVPRCVVEQGAAERERILPGRDCAFVDETFGEKRVVAVSDAAPETDLDRFFRRDLGDATVRNRIRQIEHALGRGLVLHQVDSAPGISRAVIE